MIVCHYVDKNVKNYLKNKASMTIVTLFKEPFCRFGENRVFFIDDILTELDYQEIDEFVNNTIKVAGKVFSHYLDVDGYNLFRCLQWPAKQNLCRVYKYKYAVDKMAKEERITNMTLVSCELDLMEWLKQDYRVTRLADSGSLRVNTQMKSKIKAWMENSDLVHYVIDWLFKDRRNRPYRTLWLGDRCINSKLPRELKKNFIIFLFQNDLLNKIHFIKKGVKYGSLKLKNLQEFNQKWIYIKQQYEEGLKELSDIIRLPTKLLESLLRIDKNEVKKLLLSLSILEDNKNDFSLLFVEQSVKGANALAVDYFNRHGFPSLEALHGVPGIMAFGSTTRVAVYGQRDKLFLSTFSVDTSRIAVTGCPYYDKFFDIDERKKSLEILLLILDWIEFNSSSQSYGKVFTQVTNMLNLLQYFRNERLVVKLHPTQKEKELEYVQHLVNISGMGNRVDVKKNANLTNLLKRAKLVYTFTSSVGAEALLLKKPLIILDFFPNREIEYEKYGGCLVAKNFEELLMSTKEILNNTDEYLMKNAGRIERTRRYFSADLDGESYKKVADLCEKMVNEHIKRKKKYNF